MAEETTPGGLTRPPDDRDLVALASELNRLGARYVVIGGVAINRLGFIRATEDLDLLIARDRANQQLVKQGFREKDAMDRRFLEERKKRGSGFPGNA